MLITKPKAIKLLEEAVARRGEDFVVEYCTYAARSKNCNVGSETFNDTPNCIVGQVLYDLDPETIVRINDEDLNSQNASAVLTNDKIVGDIRFTKPAVEILQIAQILQDGRDYDGQYVKNSPLGRKVPWGKTVEIVKGL